MLFLPIGAVCAAVAYLGSGLGQPVSETQIINHFAKSYVENIGDGAELSDCFAKPSPYPGVRLVVVCQHPSGTRHSYPAGPRGELTSPFGGPAT